MTKDLSHFDVAILGGVNWCLEHYGTETEEFWQKVLAKMVEYKRKAAK